MWGHVVMRNPRTCRLANLYPHHNIPIHASPFFCLSRVAPARELYSYCTSSDDGRCRAALVLVTSSHLASPRSAACNFIWHRLVKILGDPCAECLFAHRDTWVGWLVGWLVGRVGGQCGFLVGWLVGLLACFVAWLVRELVGRLAVSLCACMLSRPILASLPTTMIYPKHTWIHVGIHTYMHTYIYVYSHCSAVGM